MVNFAAKVVALIIAFSFSFSALAGNGNQRVSPQPLGKTIVKPWESTERIIVKFAEDTEVRQRNAKLVSLRGLKLNAVNRVLARYKAPATSITPLFDRPENILAEEKLRGEQRSGRKLADLSLYYAISLRANVDVGALCDELNELEIVESAVPAPLDAPPPTDISPVTPDFSALQGYASLATGGIGIAEVAGVPGADGSGMSFVDVEFGWILDHEDLELPPTTIIDDATIDNPYGVSHGTAVLGMIVAKDNGYGVTGLTPAATAFVAPIKTIEHGSNMPRAISNAIGVLQAGDVILIESQAWVCNQNYAYGPMEWHQWNFDALQTATSLGLIVVAAVGNGYRNGYDDLGVDLDGPTCEGRFDRTVRDSGAIFVGAAEAVTRNKTGYSDFGSRLDVQGWGDTNVVTTGFGNLFEPASTDERQLYTDTFSGTSSAAPMVVGAVLAIQGALRAAGEPLLGPIAMRDLLVTTGLAQGTGGHIGPLPNVPAAFAALNLPLVIEIDVDPTSAENEVAPSSDDLVSVAIHSQRISAGDAFDFDSTQVDAASLQLGVGEAANVAELVVADVDGDSDLDIVVGFQMQDTGILCDDADVAIQGSTYSGITFIGTDAITTIECDVLSCHP